ncbi:MAG TPA: ATP-binding protein [Stellaceae bacterium]|jgi:hypothetical protein|nr:ATP-binding protein [Stellaceae bacterium]
MTDDADTLKKLHRALINLNKRAERASNEILVSNFVDSEPLFDLLSTQNNQVIYGRRGTGKTHALKYLAETVGNAGDHAVYIDLRSIGSNTSIYSDTTRTLADRASTLIVDVLQAVYDELLNIAISMIDKTPNPEQVTNRIDDLARAVTAVRIRGSIEEERENTVSGSRKVDLEMGLSGGSKTSAGAKISVSKENDDGFKYRKKQSGDESIHLDFGNINVALSGLIRVVNSPRIWLLIDEWSEIPIDLQAYLADLIRRTILPINEITVKIASIEHRSQFNILRNHGEYTGLELGADISADLNLDDFLVFDNNQSKAVEFFKSLIFKHYQSEDLSGEITSPEQLIRVAFTQSPVFDEFVRAVEGVPRDALNLIGKAVTKSFGQKIAMNDVRAAARDWYQQDKANLIRENSVLSDLLQRIIDEIIGNRRARAFLFSSSSRDHRIEQLFDSRLLHILRKNVSSHDQPGVRYDVYKIDYGCYVELMNTTKMPQGLFQPTDEDDYIEVPKDDYRSIRRAILTLEPLPAVVDIVAYVP